MSFGPFRPGDPVVTHRSFHFNRRTYEWRQAGRRWELLTVGQAVARVIPDETYAGSRHRKPARASDAAGGSAT
jgi:hypothetical protein